MSTEHDFLLLTSHLGNPERKPLTTAQLRTLTQRLQWADNLPQGEQLEHRHLTALGYDAASADRIISLLEDTDELQYYVNRGKKRKCIPVTRQSAGYPLLLRKRLGLESPGCLWAKGDISLLKEPAVSLVGCRNLNQENRVFAEMVGKEAARQGYVLVSGNARGADAAAQNACLQAGGKVISVVADALHSQLETDSILYLSEEDYDAPFSAMRALRRNRVIHCLGMAAIAAQCGNKKGGTWQGTFLNLQNQWCPVYCFRDGSPAAAELEQLGAQLITAENLHDLSRIISRPATLFDI